MSHGVLPVFGRHKSIDAGIGRHTVENEPRGSIPLLAASSLAKPVVRDSLLSDTLVMRGEGGQSHGSLVTRHVPAGAP